MLPFNPGWLSLVILTIGLLSTRLLRATAQKTSAVCFSEYSWMNNSKNQNPCLVAAYLNGVCFGGQFTVESLPPGAEYSCPSGNYANACECNTVTYSLMSACATCQNGTHVDWPAWILNCSTSYVGYPESIPSGTAIPHWAYQDVAPSGNFNVTLAKAVGGESVHELCSR
ncbi:hypothetical protein EDD16DRAFT_1535435 [Pisolithus croceorrhizus]|nr:hypothetical protein EDD16DRAFT_1535435 [Pisolithus croceorrhizus]KAI6160064.1 hypothetical protein EDD17DRAFT_1606553 [Pisolithus thermaeus]